MTGEEILLRYKQLTRELLDDEGNAAVDIFIAVAAHHGECLISVYPNADDRAQHCVNFSRHVMTNGTF